jgi:hypothetical protein
MIENHNTVEDTDVKTSKLGNGGKSENILCTLSVQNDLPQQLPQIFY